MRSSPGRRRPAGLCDPEATPSRRRGDAVSLVRLLLEALDADHALRDEHRLRPVCLEREPQRRMHVRRHRLRFARLAHGDADRLEHARRALAHWHLPWVELTLLAAHGDDEEERKAAYLHHAEHVDQIADTARLHQQHRLLAAEPRARREADALLLGGERHRPYVAVGLAELD